MAIVTLNINNVAGALYKVTECSVTLAGEFSRNYNVANAKPDGRPAEYRWRPLFNAAVCLTPTTRVVQQRYQDAKPVEICRGVPNW